MSYCQPESTLFSMCHLNSVILSHIQRSLDTSTNAAANANVTSTSTSSATQSLNNTKLSVGVALGIGLPVFAALWALAFVVWSRNWRGQTTHRPQDGIEEAGPPTPQKDMSVLSYPMSTRNSGWS
ncbi:hypothetical protein BJ875DRAFT_483694 [Amylocarpus encephaloides]|uniref:Mid2 domain-containing protein n=1 Tax=Amylocarpus encephaloides TaxID=45428 RepID=A0A9P7YJD8_9HELO|nr:hypothetical protein BJ875DRAFT_483694 [Amylocarpus encephaloides]